MELPLELIRAHGALRVQETLDGSSTRLLLATSVDGRGCTLELPVTDVQDLARALLQWLYDCGHEPPDLPATDYDLETVTD